MYCMSNYIIFNFRNDVIAINTKSHKNVNSIVSIIQSSVIELKTSAHTQVNFTLGAPYLNLGILVLDLGETLVHTLYIAFSLWNYTESVFQRDVLLLWECVPHHFFEIGMVQLVVREA